MAYADSNRRRNAVHTGQTPELTVDHGPNRLSVELDTWGPQEDLFTTLYDELNATSGEFPSRTRRQRCHCADEGRPINEFQASWQHRTGWCRLTERQRSHVDDCFAGKTLQQALEMISFSFCVDGVTRAFTHEYVRTRLGAGFMQHGGRDNDWRHRRWTMPESMDRMNEAYADRLSALQSGEFGEVPYPSVVRGRKVCITDWEPIERIVKEFGAHHLVDPDSGTINEAITAYLFMGKRLYAALVDGGIAWQDARRLLPIGTQTYIHGFYNYLGMKGMLANRLEHVMDWEMNCIAQLMLRQIKMVCPPMIGRYLGSHSDLANAAKFDKLELFPPDGKYPSPTIRCASCKHLETAHYRGHLLLRPTDPEWMDIVCEQCERDGNESGVSPNHRFIAEDTLERVHRREQAPFWVLHPESMEGGPVKWLWTNGHYHDIDAQLKEEASSGDSEARHDRRPQAQA